MRIWQQGMIYLARNRKIKSFMQKRLLFSGLAKKFVGGKNEAGAVETGKVLKANGISSSLFFLGEYVEDLSIIKETVSSLKNIIRLLADAKLDIHVSVDPTQIGHQIDHRICRDNAFALAKEINTAKSAGRSAKKYLMLDMEDSQVTQPTIDLFNELRAKSLPAAITIQAYLFRSENDLSGAIRKGGAIRLVKGAFAEKPGIAFTSKADIDGNFLKLADTMLSESAHGKGFYPIFATHDDTMIDKIIRIAESRFWKKNEYEFEMLYGVRTDYQEKLVRDGEQLRVYLPYGTDWWPYAVRRVGESPKNAKFLTRALFGK